MHFDNQMQICICYLIKHEVLITQSNIQGDKKEKIFQYTLGYFSKIESNSVSRKIVLVFMIFNLKYLLITTIELILLSARIRENWIK